MAAPTPLSKKLRAALGPDVGDGIMTWLQEMRAEHEEKLAVIRAEFAEDRREMAAVIHGSESRLLDRIHAVETRLDNRIGQVEVRITEVKADLMKWSLVFWVGAVGAIAALAGVLR